MPHIKVKNFKIDFKPFEEDAIAFLAIAKGKYDDKILVKFEQKEFLLTIKPLNNDVTMIKYDKVTRINPVDIIKKAINIFANRYKLDILSSNTVIAKYKPKPQISYLKDFDFFIGDLSKKFEKIVLEIGFGSGKQLLYLAQNNKDITYIGLEIYNPSIEQVLKQIKLNNINNIYLVNYDARAFLEILESNILDEILVHFPIPWDKKPHRRIISQNFIKEANRTLKKGGTLHLRTDSDNYFKYSYEEFLKLKQFDLKIQKNIKSKVVSKYEARWLRLNKDIYDIFFTSLEESRNKELDGDFSFEEIDYNKLDSLPKKAIVENDFLIRFEQKYIIDKYNLLLKVTFGDFNKPEHQYIKITPKNCYYLSTPAPTATNIKAHKVIKEYVCSSRS